MYIGIDVGGTNLKAGLVNEQGEIVAVERTPLDFKSVEQFAKTLAELALTVIETGGVQVSDVEYVGVGIPGLSNERNILRDYYENKCERGYDYAYTFPGMNRVLQAAGRVIRTEQDRGVLVLVDSRYAEEPYLHLYPAHWQGITAAANASALAHRLERFWALEKNSEEKL